MTLTRLAAPVVAASLVFSGLAAPQAQAHETVYNKDTDTCTITFTDKDQERVNGAYKALFVRLAEQTRDSFTGTYAGQEAKGDAQIVWEYGTRDDVKSAADLPIPADLRISNAQTRLALGDEKDKYWQMVGFLNASKKPVVTERTITMTPEVAAEKGGVTYGVDLGSAIGGVAGGLLLAATPASCATASWPRRQPTRPSSAPRS